MSGPLGRDILAGRADFRSLQRHAIEHGEPELQSGRQEMLENILDDYLCSEDT